MKINMQQGKNSYDISHNSWEIGFVGEIIDDRCREGTSFLTSNCTEKIYTIKYNAENYVLEVNSDKVIIDDWYEYFNIFKKRKIVIDATSVGFVELLMIVSAFKKLLEKEIDIIYIEPDSYRKDRNYSLLQNRNFELSGEILGYLPIPNFTGLINETFEITPRLICFAGYESSRLQRIFEDIPDLKAENCTLVFGVPAFKPGWETNTFANNINIIKEKGLAHRIMYSGASNPLAAFNKLKKVLDSKSNTEQFFIVPIGTKPEGIGCAIFAAAYENIGILYDHPIKDKGRTSNISAWHLYTIEF